MAQTYGRDVAYSGPLYRSFEVEGDKIRVFFDHTAGGLATKGDGLKTFEIAGADRRFVPAEAVVEGESVVVRSAAVAQPVAVRYAWSNDALPKLFNAVGLPASPFRTDDWPGITDHRR